MFMEDHVTAIREFLQTEFPGAAIEDDPNIVPGASRFRILDGARTYLAAFQYDFLEEVHPSEMASCLAGLTLIEHLKDLPGTLVLVTRSGLQLEEE